MFRFLHDDQKVAYIRSQYALGMHNLLGIGSCSELYAAGNNVYRLSSDGSSQYLIGYGNRKGLAVPRMYRNFGTVATIDEDWGEYYWLCELEKMSTLPTAAHADLQQWLEALLDPVGDELVLGHQFPLMEHFLIQCRDEGGRYAALSNTLLSFIDVCNGDLDLGTLLSR